MNLSYMLAVLALVVAAASLGVSAALAVRLRYVAAELETLRRRPTPERTTALEPGDKPLEGLRILLAIEQDHAHPVFANLVKDALLREEAEPVEGGEFDLKISGSLVGNGYADVYYTAEFTCETAQGPLLTLLERPPHGDRPGNLALELVTRLKREVEKARRRGERSSALRELTEFSEP